MKLIPNWRKAWRMASVRFGLVLSFWLAQPHEWQLKTLSLVPGLTADQVSFVLVALILIGRLIYQPKVREEAAYTQETMLD